MDIDGFYGPSSRNRGFYNRLKHQRYPFDTSRRYSINKSKSRLRDFDLPLLNGRGFSFFFPFVLFLFAIVLGKPLFETVRSILSGAKSVTDGATDAVKDILGTSSSAVLVKDTISDPGSPFSPSYWRSRSPAKILTMAQSSSMCKDIYDSIGFFSCDYGKIFATIKVCQYKSQVSFLAFRFKELYSEDLLTYFSDQSISSSLFRRHLSPDQTAAIIDYVNGLSAFG